MRLEEIEKADRIRAIVCAVSSADAAVVDLSVQTFVGMISRIDRTDGLTRRLFTLLTKDRHEFDFDIRELAFEVALDSNPVDRAALCGFFGSDDRDVVFDSTGDDARFAPGAPIEIDHHCPLRFI